MFFYTIIERTWKYFVPAVKESVVRYKKMKLYIFHNSCCKVLICEALNADVGKLTCHFLYLIVLFSTFYELQL